jgi:hypothetical protein
MSEYELRELVRVIPMISADGGATYTPIYNIAESIAAAIEPYLGVGVDPDHLLLQSGDDLLLQSGDLILI